MIGTVADGGIGPNTLKKVAEYVDAHGIESTIENFQQARQSYYESLSTFETFGRGWTRRVDETTDLAKTMV
jgi:lysozyme family protein